MNLIDRAGRVHPDPLHVRPSYPIDIVPTTPNGDTVPGASRWPVVDCMQDRDHEARQQSRAADYGDKIASDVLDAHAIQPHFVRTGEQIATLLAEAARRGYELGYGAR